MKGVGGEGGGISDQWCFIMLLGKQHLSGQSKEAAIQRVIRGGKGQKEKIPGNGSPTHQSLLNICAAYYLRNILIR